METKDIYLRVTNNQRKILQFIYDHNDVDVSAIAKMFGNNSNFDADIVWLANQKMIARIDGDKYVAKQFGKIFIERNNEENKNRKWTNIRYWITTGIAVAAFALSVVALIRSW